MNESRKEYFKKYYQENRARIRLRQRRTPLFRKCEICNGVFSPKTGWHKFCSKGCKYVDKKNTYANKHRANNLLTKAIKNNKVKKPEKCSVCLKKAKIDGHHYDYSKPYDVIWVCRQCHSNIHHNIRLLNSATPYHNYRC